jgi:hypothetical protein
MSAVVAVTCLLLSLALLPVPGGVVFAPFLFGLFLLALLGVFAGLEDRSVRSRQPAMDPRKWRDGE